MNILKFITAASRPTMAQETIHAIIKTRHIPMEEKRDLAELTFNSVAQDHEGGIRIDTFFKNFMINMLMLFHYTDLEFTTGEGPDWIRQLMSEYDRLVEADLVDKIIAEIGSDYQDTLQVIEDYFRDRLHKGATLRFFNADVYTPIRGPITDFSFRQLHHRYVLLLMENASYTAKVTFSMLKPRPKDNALLLYGYIDSSAGLSFQTMCPAYYSEDGNVDLSPADPICVMRMRYDAMRGTLISVDPATDLERFDGMVQIINECYTTSPEIEEMRDMKQFDQCRHPQFPDDLLVILSDDKQQKEGVWLRPNNYDKMFVRGTLLNEPNGNFGCRCGDQVTAFVFTEGEDSYLIAANYNV